MEELYIKEKNFQAKQFLLQPNYSHQQSKQDSILKEVQKNQNQNFNFVNSFNMKKNILTSRQSKNSLKRKDYLNILKIDNKKGKNCVKISLNTLKKNICQNPNMQSIYNQNKRLKTLQNKCLKKDIQNLSDLCIVAEGRKRKLQNYQQKLRFTYSQNKQSFLNRYNSTTRQFSSIQFSKDRTKNEIFKNYNKKKQMGYQKRLIRYKTHENVVKKMFSRYDYFKNDKQDIISIVNKIKNSLKENKDHDYFFQI